ncbi:hypothetical protein AYO38_04995 [bacterium SCGC AG-212-C10]|nr:hypothetical protein AYO38_04995 [bacterium SCGC AG-212-C10]
MRTMTWIRLNRTRAVLAMVVVMTAALGSIPLLVSAAPSPSGYEIVASNWDGGGGTLTGATYSITGAAGQPDAGVLTGATYTIYGGFIQPSAGNPQADANCDGLVTAADAVFIMRVLASLSSEIPPCTIDADNNGQKNPQDAIWVLQIVAGLHN